MRWRRRDWREPSKASTGEELLSVWEESVAFFIEVTELAEAYPADDTYHLRDKCHEAAFSVSQLLARGKRVQSPLQAVIHFEEARESVARAVANVYIACHFQYVEKKAYLRIFKIGRKLSHQIDELNAGSATRGDDSRGH